jgi:hypothetical protein
MPPRKTTKTVRGRRNPGMRRTKRRVETFSLYIYKVLK